MNNAPDCRSGSGFITPIRMTRDEIDAWNVRWPVGSACRFFTEHGNWITTRTKSALRVYGDQDSRGAWLVGIDVAAFLPAGWMLNRLEMIEPEPALAAKREAKAKGKETLAKLGQLYASLEKIVYAMEDGL